MEEDKKEGNGKMVCEKDGQDTLIKTDENNAVEETFKGGWKDDIKEGM